MRESFRRRSTVFSSGAALRVHDRRHEIVGERVEPVRRLDAVRPRRREVAADRLYVEAELLRDAPLRHAEQPRSQDLFDLQHRDLAERHRRLPSVDGRSVAVGSRRWGRERF